MNKTKIDWCDMTWNPVTGCLHNCKYCYAKKIANRFGGSNFCANCDVVECSHYNDKGCLYYNPKETVHELNELQYFYQSKKADPYPYRFEPTFHKYRLDEPSKKTKGRNIFVCSMSDLFGDWVPESWIEQVFEACENAPQHKYLFLTKNPKRFRQSVPFWKKNHGRLKNMWFGTTATNQQEANKNIIEMAFTLGNKFLSLEPLNGEINLRKIETKDVIYDCLTGYVYSLTGHDKDRPKIDWVIVGAETGKGSKLPKKEWVQSIIDQCRDAGVPVFLKDNLKWHEKIQEFPKELL